MVRMSLSAALGSISAGPVHGGDLAVAGTAHERLRHRLGRLPPLIPREDSADLVALRVGDGGIVELFATEAIFGATRAMVIGVVGVGDRSVAHDRASRCH